MNIFIAYDGVDNHIDDIREELRNVERLRDQLRVLLKNSDISAVDPRLLRRCADEVKHVEESVRFRMQFLNDLIVDMHRTDAEIGRIIDELSARGGFDGE